MVKIGDPVPAFTLTDDRGKNVELSDFRGSKVVVYFFPKANTMAAPSRRVPFAASFQRSRTKYHRNRDQSRQASAG